MWTKLGGGGVEVETTNIVKEDVTQGKIVFPKNNVNNYWNPLGLEFESLVEVK